MKSILKATRFIIVLVIIAFPVLLWGSDMQLSARLDRADIKFEETVDLTVEVKWTGDILDYNFKIFALPQAERMRVLGTTSKISSDLENGVEITTRTYQYTFQPTEAGKGVIYPITLNYIAMPDSVPGELSTPELSVIIAEPVAVKKTEMGRTLWVFIIGLVFLVGGLAVFVIVLRRRAKPREPIITPSEHLLGELDKIKKESAGDRQAFFTRLHKALLHYIEKQYQLDLLGLTLEAIVSRINALEIAEDDKSRLAKWLKMAEKEKFAPGTGSPGEALRLATEIENFVKNKSFRES